MSNQLIQPGEKFHIITRRLFADDLRRHFAGEVIKADGQRCVIKGFAYVFNASMNRYEQRSAVRNRIFALGDGLHIVNRLPSDTVIEQLEYCMIDQRLMVVDSSSRSGYALDINEFNHSS